MNEEELLKILNKEKSYTEDGLLLFIYDLRKQNTELKEQVEELKHIMYVIRDDNGLNHLWCKDMILDWLGSDSK